MNPLQGDHNKSHPGSLTSLVQVHWSRQRCWAGEEVTISVRASRVKDNAPVEMAILPEGNNQSPVDTVQGKTVSNSKLDHPYPMEWKEKPFGDSRKFVIQATVETKLKAPISPALYVDLEPPIFSA
jgi:hypothetical protein